MCIRARLRHEPREPGVRLQQPAPRADPVGHVDERVGPLLGEVRNELLPHQLGVHLGHAVHAVAADDGEVRQPDVLRMALLALPVIPI